MRIVRADRDLAAELVDLLDLSRDQATLGALTCVLASHRLLGERMARAERDETPPLTDGSRV